MFVFYKNTVQAFKKKDMDIIGLSADTRITRRAAIPENFQFFRATFAEHLRDLDASLEISVCIRTHFRLVQEVQ